MRQIWIPRPGPPEVLELREAPDPTPAAGQVRIRVEAAGVNFADIMGRMGMYPDLPRMPVVVGYEVAGRIDAVGAGVTEDWIGADIARAHALRRLQRRDLRPRGAGLRATRRHGRGAGSSLPGELPHRLAARPRDGEPARGRDHARALGRRRRRNRRDADRKTPRRAGDRDRIGRQARARCASSASITASTTRARISRRACARSRTAAASS